MVEEDYLRPRLEKLARKAGLAVAEQVRALGCWLGVDREIPTCAQDRTVPDLPFPTVV